jgi:hypothetical protein
LDNIKFHNLFIANTAQVLLWVILDDRGLMDEYVLFGVISVNESVSITDIKPFHRASDFSSYDINNLF